MKIAVHSESSVTQPESLSSDLHVLKT
jgi:hypothetical protein